MLNNIYYIAAGDRQRASTRYRVHYISEELKKHSYSSKIKQHSNIHLNQFGRIEPYLSALRDLAYASLSDIVHIQKVRLSKKELNLLNRFNHRTVYDFDDATYAVQPWKDSEDSNQNIRLNKTLSSVSCVIAGSTALADYAEEYCDNVYIIPTSLPQPQYRPYWTVEKNRQDDEVTLGWIGNPENLWYLKQIEQPLKEVLSSNDVLNLHVITSDDRNITPLADRIGNDVYYKTWSLENELDLLNEVDIGIRPLTDDAWTRAKGGYTSVVQCMGLGIPVVVSPIGMLSDIVIHGECGFHATSNSHWKSHIETLVKDPELRAEMGQCAIRRLTEKDFWIEQQIDNIISVYESL